MKINSLSPLKYNNPIKFNRSLNFEGGYKDIVDIREKIWFESCLDGYIRNAIKNSFFFHGTKYIKAGEKTAKLRIYKNKNYVLTSSDNKIKAVMEIFCDKHTQDEIEDDFYSKNKGAVKILLLFSKGEGAGTALIKEAVKKSFIQGFGGRVILLASSLNKASGCPVPFYYKLGFKAANAERQQDIEKGMEHYNRTGFYTGPIYSVMYLDKERIKDYLD